LIAGLTLAILAFGLYLATNPERRNLWNHFVWQADAWLHGRAWIPYPTLASGDLPRNDYLNDVWPMRDAAGNPMGQGLIPFPPLPAVVLLPFVAIAGLAVDQELVAAWIGALGVGLAWWMLGPLPVHRGVRFLVAAFFATGTAWWWSASAGSTWYLAHLVATDLLLLATGRALRADAGAADVDGWGGADGAARDGAGGDEAAAGPRNWLRRMIANALPLDRSQGVVGLLVGLAATARLPVLLAVPFFLLVGRGGTWQRRAASAGVGVALPVAVLLAYTWATTGALIHPGYEAQYAREVVGYPAFDYRADWAVEDLRYLPRNVALMLGSLPAVMPDYLPNTLGMLADVPVCTEPGATRALFDPACPIAVPRDIGTSILLTSPAFLLAAIPLARRRWSRVVLGSLLAALAIAVFDLAHFSQGWVQWGYRFSNDYVPFLLILTALGAGVGASGRGRPRVIAVALVLIAAIVNFWGVTWGGILVW